MRVGWLSVVLLGACTVDVPPSWLLGEYPEVLGLRMEVIADGPYSTGFLPIPADRIRSEALPGDTVRVIPLVANVDGIVDLAPLDARWILAGAGLYTVRQPSIGACRPEEPLDPEGACELGRGAEIAFVIPPLRPGVPLVEQHRPTIVLVAGIDRSSAECVEVLASETLVGASECLIAYRRVNLGPIMRLGEIAIEHDVPLPFELDDIELPDWPVAETPDFSPESPSLSLLGDWSEMTVWPGETASVPADAVFDLGFGFDPRDEQPYVSINATGEVVMNTERVYPNYHLTAPAIVDYHLLAPTSELDRFQMFVVETDSRRSQSWAVYDFDVVGE